MLYTPNLGNFWGKDSHILEILFGATQRDSDSVNTMEDEVLSQSGKKEICPLNALLIQLTSCLFAVG